MASSILKPRPPVVVVVGHVDHGKTTLLDYIRKTNVASREAGGITQSIGAYEIEHQIAHTENARGAPSVRKITFIDTPGHEAFTHMRSTGATVADLAILVIAADEGVKPQTKEAIQILKDTATPYVVAVTKIDKPGANLEKVKNDLASEGVLLEGYGGNIPYHGVSSKTGEGVNDLLDLVLLAADLENHSWDPSRPASGFILETSRGSQRGIEAVMILKDGVLRQGNPIATPSASGKVKILENFLAKRVEELEPSAPAVIIGFETAPRVGEKFIVGEALQQSAPKAATRSAVPSLSEERTKALAIILKASDAGSLEALSLIVRNLNTPTPIRVIAESVGDINDSDVKLAVASGAVIAGFKTKVQPAAKTLATSRNVRIQISAVIYELVKTIEELSAEPQTGVLGQLEILAIFNQSKLERQVVGGKVTKGTFRNKAQFAIRRNGEISGEGHVLNLQKDKKDTANVAEGNEAGLLVKAPIPLAVGDELTIQT